MNNFIGIGRLTKAPEVRYTTGNPPVAVSRFSIAIDRRYKREGEQTADFINCIAFGKTAEFVEKYVGKGTKIAAQGRIQSSTYKNRDGNTVYAVDFVVENIEFAESKKEAAETKPAEDKFMSIPDDVAENLPFV